MKDVNRKHLKELAARKIKEEQDKKQEKIIKEIAKKHKSDWRKELEENFTVVSNGPTNSATQTFQHVSGQNFSFSGIGGQEGHPSTVTVFGEPVPAPNYNQLGIAGYANPLSVIRRRDPEDTNKKLDASQEFAQKVGADVMMNARVSDNSVKGSLDNVAKTLSDKIKKLIRDKGDKTFNLVFQKLFPFATDRFASEARTFLKYLTGINNQPITNKSISKSHLQSLFKNATITSDGRVNMKDFIVGTGQVLKLDPTTNTFYFDFNYDFNDNATELLKRNVDGWTRFTSDLIGANHGYDSNALYGKMIDIAKSLGQGQGVTGRFNIPVSELMNMNKEFVRDSIKASTGYDIAENGYQMFSPDQMMNLFMKGGDVGSPEALAGVHAYYAMTGQLPRGARAKGTVPMNQYDHPEYDPAVIKKINLMRRAKVNFSKQQTPKEPSKAVEKIKSISKTRNQSLSLDEPIVRRRKKRDT